MRPGPRRSAGWIAGCALTLAACAAAPPPPPEPAPPPPPQPIAIPTDAPPAPEGSSVEVDAYLLDLVVTSAPAAEQADTVRFVLSGSPETFSGVRRDGLLEIESSTGWSSRVRGPESATGPDPVAALLTQINGIGDVSIEDLEPPPMDEGEALVLRVLPVRLDFATGVGIRYLAAYTDDYAPLTDDALVYVFEGLTRDGRYHVLLILPVAARVLPDAPEPGTLETSVEFAGITDAYVATVTEQLEHAAMQGFKPSLERLDAFARSVVIR